MIVNSKTDITKSYMTTHQVRQIFTMRKTVWPNGQAITVFVLPTNSSLHQKFSKEVLKIFPYQLERIWQKLTYSGLGKVPVLVKSLDELKIAVINTPGAIGYIDDLQTGDVFHVIEIKE